MDLIGFFLKALRICSPEFFEAGIPYVINSFMKHKYPRSVLRNLRKKTGNIKDQTLHPLLIFSYHRLVTFPRRSVDTLAVQ